MSRVVLLLVLLFAMPARAELVERSQWVMGTQLRIVIEDPPEPDLFDECFALAAHWEQVLSRWDPEAELARLNASAGTRFEASEELFSWLERCRRDRERTEGAFDPTVGTWILLPDSEAQIGMDRLRLDAELGTVLLPEGVALDSGGDGKGVAVDAIVARLREAGVEALVDFGGSSLYGIGDGPRDDGWRLAVTDVTGEVAGEATLVDAALSVSHSVQVDQAADGPVRRFHIYDPSTGELVREERTAIAWSRSATEAEVVSTALVVRGAGGLAILGNFPSAEAVLSPDPRPCPSWWEPAR